MATSEKFITFSDKSFGTFMWEPATSVMARLDDLAPERKTAILNGMENATTCFLGFLTGIAIDSPQQAELMGSLFTEQLIRLIKSVDPNWRPSN